MQPGQLIVLTIGIVVAALVAAIVAGLMASKWIAAELVGRAWKFSANDRGLMQSWGLSVHIPTGRDGDAFFGPGSADWRGHFGIAYGLTIHFSAKNFAELNSITVDYRIASISVTKRFTTNFSI